jgi:hypothetical protein
MTLVIYGSPNAATRILKKYVHTVRSVLTQFPRIVTAMRVYPQTQARVNELEIKE